MSATLVIERRAAGSQSRRPVDGAARFSLHGPALLEQLNRLAEEEQAERDRKAELALLGELARFD